MDLANMGKRITIAAVVAAVLLIAAYFAYNKWVDPARPDIATTPSPAVTASQSTIVLEVTQPSERRVGDGWVPVVKGIELNVDDEIRTGPGGETILRVGGVGQITLAESSRMAVGEVTHRLARVRVGEGQVFAIVTGDARMRVSVEGSDAIAEGAGGAEFSVLTEGGGTAVATRKGRVEFTSGGARVTLGRGEISIASANAKPSKPAPIPSSLFVKLGRSPRNLRRRKHTFTGTTVPGSVVSLNDVTVMADADGKFTAKIPLKEGLNNLVINVRDPLGREETVRLPTINVDTKKPTADSQVKWDD